MIKKKRKFIYLLITTFLIISCEKSITQPNEHPQLSNMLTGKVLLENQTEHSNALVYIDSLNRGVSTDSNGNYTIIFTDADTIYNGEFKLIYFLNDYDMDSAKIVLVNGKVKLDSLDINAEGKIETKELKQIVLIEGWTDKQEYRISDTLEFTTRFTNLSGRIIHIWITSLFNPLGYVGLYNDKYFPIGLSPPDPVLLEKYIDIFPGGYYEGNAIYTIPEGEYINQNLYPLLPDEYLVTTGFFIEGRLTSPFQSKFSNYVLEEWYKIHRGISPQYDFFPNKYRFPHIDIIE